MGKSLRSKSKLKFRTVKRASGVFGKADRERAARLAEKLGTTGTGLSSKQDEEGEVKKNEDENENENEDEKEDGEMEVDEEGEGMYY